MDISKPILGDIPAFTITTPDLESSLAFYQKIGFKELYRADWPFPWIMVCDDAIQIMLRKDENPYLAMTYYVPDINQKVEFLKGNNIIFTFTPGKSDMVKRYLFQSPDGLNISLVEIQEGFTKPTGNTMLTTAPSDYFSPEKYTNKVTGLFGELAHPVKNLEKSIPFWETLGFKVLSKFTSPYPWAILSDGLHIVGAHQTETFDQPALTFFASDMKDKIEKIREGNIDIYKEQGPSNIVLRSPEQQNINLFKLGM